MTGASHSQGTGIHLGPVTRASAAPDSQTTAHSSHKHSLCLALASFPILTSSFSPRLCLSASLFIYLFRTHTHIYIQTYTHTQVHGARWVVVRKCSSGEKASDRQDGDRRTATRHHTLKHRAMLLDQCTVRQRSPACTNTIHTPFTLYTHSR